MPRAKEIFPRANGSAALLWRYRRGFFQDGKAQRRGSDHSHPSLCQSYKYMGLHLHSPNVNFILYVVQVWSGVVKCSQYINSLSPPRTIPSAENKYVYTLSQMTCITNLLTPTKWMKLAGLPQFLLTERYHLLTPGELDSGLLNRWLHCVLPPIRIREKRWVHYLFMHVCPHVST
jgi:hypothetical protein